MNESLNRCGHYPFEFISSGFFTLVDEKGEPLYEQSLPFFEKVVSHLVWMFFWLALILATHPLLPNQWIAFLDPFLMLLIFLHLFLFGCRLTTLLLQGGLMPIIFPPLWIRLTRKLQKGSGIELLQKHNLDNHPGLLANLALIQSSRGELDRAHTTLSQALAHAPDHPILIVLFNAIVSSQKG